MKIEHTPGSENIFADLNVPNPQEMLVKARLASFICDLIEQRKLTQEEAALILGIDQPKISALMNGKFPGFSLERILKFLNKLDQDVIITIKPADVKRMGNIDIQTNFVAKNR